MSTEASLVGPTLEDALRGETGAPKDQVLRVAEQLNLIGNALSPSGLATPIEIEDCRLSGGQHMRALLARALISGKAIIADEPTAKLDGANAEAARRALRAAATTRLVIVATHDAALISLGDVDVRLSIGPVKRKRGAA